MNNDGKLSKKEAKKIWDRFGPVDANKDNFITRKELESYFEVHCRHAITAVKLVGYLMDCRDRNGDEKLTKKELKKIWKALLLKRADFDRNKRLTVSELVTHIINLRLSLPGGGVRTYTVEWYLRSDRDRDGKVSKKEFYPGRWEGGAARYDINKDGFLDKRELKMLIVQVEMNPYFGRRNKKR